jgi:adenylate kinase
MSGHSCRRGERQRPPRPPAESLNDHNIDLVVGIIFGPPGSGKGTQAQLITDALGTAHISTGELLRAEADAGSPLGLQVAPLLEAGHLVPDELIERVVEQRLRVNDAASGALLDGYPRTVPQARALDEVLATSGRPIDFVLFLRVDPEALTKRLLHRAAEQHRADDNPESIAERLAEYRDLTTPVLDYYRGRGVSVLEIDGSGSVDEVHRRAVEALRSLQRPDAR